MQMRWISALLLALMVSSCSTPRGGKPGPLRVGVTPNYPPLIMKQGEKAAGVECDFAVQLAAELGRPLQILPVPWELLLEELEDGRIDIVMSGMTITPAREVRATFCDSYMNNPLVAISRRGESGNFPAANIILGWNGSVGVLTDTSADAFVRRSFPNAKILPLTSPDDVAFYLANQRIDLYIDDFAAAVGIVSRNETRLELVRIPLGTQELAWAVQLGDETLRLQANEALARWRENGYLDRILDRWMPYRQQIAGADLQE